MEIVKVWFDKEYIYIKTNVGHIVGNPLFWFPNLMRASQKQRDNFHIGHFGVHWEELDEDLSLEGFFTFKVEKDKEEESFIESSNNHFQ